MRAKFSAPVIALLALTMLPSAAWARYCGVARYRGCVPCCCKQQCHTVMKTVRCTKMVQKQVTCCKTVYDRGLLQQDD